MEQEQTGVGRIRAAWRRLGTADRSFVLLVAVALLPVALVTLAGCGVLGFIAYRVGADGLAALDAEQDLRPAVAFVAVFVLGLGIGARSLLVQLAATRRLDRMVASTEVPAPAALRAIADRRLVDVAVVPADEPFSFAYGLVSPRVVVSTGLLDVLSEDETRAVLEHERYHVRALDPLKVVTARTLGAAFFYLPVLRPLRRRYVAGRELAADRRAVDVAGTAALAGALYRSVAGPAWTDLGGAAALGGTDVLEDRIRHLETGEEPPAVPLSRAVIAGTAAVLALLVGALVYTVVEAGGPSGLMRGRMDDDGSGMGSGGWLGAAVPVALVLLAATWLRHLARRREG